MSNRSRWPLIWVVAILPLLGWWITGLFDLDEGFYGAVVGEMNRRHEWITPYFNGQPWFEKPILLYWLAKPTIGLLGPDLGARLPSVLCAIGVLVLVAWFVKRHFDEAISQMSVLVLASSLLFVAIGRMMMTDMPLVLCLTAAFFTFWESLKGQHKMRLWTGLALGFGVLAKGPVALILFGIVMVWMWARHPELRKGFRGSWPLAFVVLIASISLWYVPAYLVNGQTFVQKFLIEQNVGRFTGGDAAHTWDGLQNYFYYIPILLLGMIPWSFWIPKAMLKRDGIEAELRSYLITWSVVIFIFFTVSGAKLMHYVLPMFPAMAILIAAHLHSAKVQKFALAWTIAMAFIANAGFILWYRTTAQDEAHSLARFVSANAGSDSVALYQFSRRQTSRGTGEAKLQETTLPSLLLYLNRTATDTDDPQEILKLQRPVWVLTRTDRIFGVLKPGVRIETLDPGLGWKNFKLWRLVDDP